MASTNPDMAHIEALEEENRAFRKFYEAWVRLEAIKSVSIRDPSMEHHHIKKLINAHADVRCILEGARS